MKSCFLTSLLVSVLSLGSIHSRAQPCSELVIPASDRGWYDAGGNHYPWDNQYFCGDSADFAAEVVPHRNWFVFAIPVLTQQVLSASLRINTFDFGSPTGSETFQLRHVSAAGATLQAGGTGLRTLYDDLGDGTIYGSRTFQSSDSYQRVVIPLNDSFLTNLAAAAGSLLAVGGEVSTLDDVPVNNEFIFRNASSEESVDLVLTVDDPRPLAINTQPQDQSVSAGTSLFFHVGVCGAAPITYQWQHDGTNIPSPAEATLYLNEVTSEQAGEYRVIVSNASGSVTSAVATLSVNMAEPAVSIFQAGGASPAYMGDSINLCANATGIPAPALQWQFNGNNIPGQTNQCFPQFNLQADQSGEYTVVASNAVGVATSAPMSILVVPQPLVYARFESGFPPFAVGSFAYVCAVVNTSPAPALQWQFNGTDLPGETNQCLYINAVTLEHAGTYTLRASGLGQDETGFPLELTVFHQPPGEPYLYFAQGSPAALVGNDVSVCFVADGSPPLAQQWRFNGTNLPGANAACLNLLQIQPDQAGDYSLVVSNLAGAVTSAVVSITVEYQEPIIVEQPQDRMVVEGTTVRFASFASAGPPATHVLQFNGADLPVPFTYDATGGFTLLDVTPADAGEYRIIASNALGVATSQVARLTVTPAGPLDRWTQRNPLPQSQRLFSLAYGDGLFVAVGERGTVLTSTDGTNWFLQSRRVDLSLLGVTHGAGMFVAVGAGGTILSSADGTNWANRYTAPFELTAVGYGGDRFIALGEGSVGTILLTSADGISWERLAGPAVLAGRGITFGNGTFVAVGRTAIITSTNGMDWRVALSPLASELESVSFVQNQFIAVGNHGYMLASSDGVSWTLRDSGTDRRLLGVTHGNGRFVAAGVRGIIRTSSDAIAWGPAASGTPDRLEAITFANALFIAAGENGTTITSGNGANWGRQNRGITRDLDGMAVADGTVVVVGKGGSILTSTDGEHYTAQNSQTTEQLHGVAWGNDLWVAVGEPGILLTSPDATQWTSRPSGNTNSLKGATYSAGKWVVVGTEGAVITSPDGVNWSAAVTTPNFDLNDVAYGNGVFVIAGDGEFSRNGSAFVSPDAVTWTWVTYPFSKNLRSILFTNGFFLATANDGNVFTSTNGLNWLPHFTWLPHFSVPVANLRGATFAHGLWIVVGNHGTILTSPNLSDWTVRPTRTFENLHEVVYLEGRLITIGNRGTILQSDRFVSALESLRYDPALGATLTLKGLPGQAYQIETSTNLQHWAPLVRFTNAVEQTSFTDADALGHPHRFYRLVED